MTRASIREGILDKGSASFKTETMELFGEEVVVRQPSLRAMFRTQEAENNRESLVDLMLKCCYPNTVSYTHLTLPTILLV